MNKISILIPVFNEADAIGRLLVYLQDISDSNLINEIVVIDGGSTDKTIEVVAQFKDIRLLNSQKGRAKQMNLGAENATGSILYFLHCDSFPPKGFDMLIINHVQSNKQAGCFKMQFDDNHFVLRVSQWFTRFNHISCRGGDQSLFVTKSLFRQIGGFNENFIIYEDNEIIKRLYQKDQFSVIQKPIITSARRYKEHGVWRLQYHFCVIHFKKRMGQSPDQLLIYYKKHVK